MSLPEKLYNGIMLPEEWPPQTLDPQSDVPMPVPYLKSPPDVIPIDLGRQLFVDDFLVLATDMTRVFHRARKIEGNPVMRPETPLERQSAGIFPAAVPKDGGVWWDPRDGLFKMWYEAGWCGALAYAVSEDGLCWQRPCLDVQPPTNCVVSGLVGDSGAVVLDLDTKDSSQRFKMFHRECNQAIGSECGHGNCLVSPDGIHWSEPIKTGHTEDRTTMFYNPFRKKWVYSLRFWVQSVGRARFYREHADFLGGADWAQDDIVFWCRADQEDPADPAIGDLPQLYNLNAVAYESIMLGLFEIHLGPDNAICEQRGFPKTTELMTSFSRDGFHWHRPDRRAFIPAARREGAWDRGYVQSVGGICLVQGDELWFYYTGFQGDSRNTVDKFGFRGGMYAHGSTGIATLRRDGFASMRAGSAEAFLLTRPLIFSGEHLFVNIDNPSGALRIEVCDEEGNPFPGYEKESCRVIVENSTKIRVQWKQQDSLSKLSGKPVRFRFFLVGGDLYSFWVSPSSRGESNGFLAAGGKGLKGLRDS